MRSVGVGLSRDETLEHRAAAVHGVRASKTTRSPPYRRVSPAVVSRARRFHPLPLPAEPVLLSRILLFLVFIVVPAIEIALFIVVGEMIGVLPTVLLVFVTAFVGVTLARRQGFDTLQRLRLELERDRVPGEEIGNAVTIVIAGILLLVPGFFTDALGLVLFVPGVRRALWRRVKRTLGPTLVQAEVRRPRPPGEYPAGEAGPPPERDERSGGDRVIDLDPEDYGPAREDTPWRPDRDR